MDWLDEALCRGKHQDLWFPPFGDERLDPEDRYYDIAKMVCEHCPVQQACSYAGADEDFGVWGGSSPSDRRRGRPTKPPYVMMPQYINRVIPEHDGTRVDVKQVWSDMKRYADKRS